MQQDITKNNAAREAGQYLDICAQGGSKFSVRLINDYDATQPLSMQAGEYLGRIEVGDLDDEGQYRVDDDDIVDYARKQYGIAATTPAGVR